MSQENPYAAPRADLETQVEVDRLVLASRGTRFANYLVDYFLFQVLACGLLVPVIFLMAMSGSEEEPSDAIFFVVSLAALVFYFSVQEATFGRTVGKLVTGTKVVNEQGGPITVGQAFGRTLLRMVPFEPFSALFGKQCIPWHDRYSKTRVVSARPQLS